jgi:hypothetical protein
MMFEELLTHFLQPRSGRDQRKNQMGTLICRPQQHQGWTLMNETLGLITSIQSVLNLGFTLIQQHLRSKKTTIGLGRTNSNLPSVLSFAMIEELPVLNLCKNFEELELASRFFPPFFSFCFLLSQDIWLYDEATNDTSTRSINLLVLDITNIQIELDSIYAHGVRMVESKLWL